MLKLTQLFLFLLISFTFLNYSRSTATQILVFGKIFDENTNQPLGVNIEFRDASGKKIKTQSNSITGEFQQVLNAGEKFTIVLSSTEILRREFKFQAIDTNQYVEQKVEWFAFKPVVGSRIFHGSIFDEGRDIISEKGKEILEELQMALRFNRSLNVTFHIYAEKVNVDKKGKKTISADNDLINRRIQNLNNIVENWVKEKSRIKIQADTQNKEDLVVKIHEIKSYID